MKIVKKLHNTVALTRSVTGNVVVVYVVFEVNDTQFLHQDEGGRDTVERSVVHSQGRGAAHCHKLILVDCYNTSDPSRCTNIWKAQGTSIGRNYWREHYKSRIPRNFRSSFTTNRFGLIHRVVEERRRHNMQRKKLYLAISESITKESYKPINNVGNIVTLPRLMDSYMRLSKYRVIKELKMRFKLKNNTSTPLA